jgi:hypothetical protein
MDGEDEDSAFFPRDSAFSWAKCSSPSLTATLDTFDILAATRGLGYGVEASFEISSAKVESSFFFIDMF